METSPILTTQASPDTPRPLWGPVVLLLISMVSLQAGAAFAKQLLPALGAAGTATLRLFFASTMLCLVCRPWRVRLGWRPLGTIALYGLTIAGMNTFIYLSLLSIPLGIAVALEFLGPLSVAVLASRQKRDFVWVGLAAVGVALLIPRADAATALRWQGIVYALIAAAFWATYIVVGQRAGTAAPSGAVASIGMVAGALAIAPLGIATSGAALLDSRFWPAALGIALLSSAVPYYLEIVALAAMPARTFGTLMSMEPAVAAISGLVILQEHLTTAQWTAVLLIMLASFGAVAYSRTPPAPELAV